MSESAPYEKLIARLTTDLRPVRRLRPPPQRALSWLGLVIALGVALASVADLHAMMHRLMAAADMWLAVLGSILTCVLAVLAAFQLSLPDRSTAWALLPVPGVLLWLGASGAGCLRGWVIPGSHAPGEGNCLVFIVAVSVPLSAALLLMLRRAAPLRPDATAAMGGLAAAAAAATLLNFFHPYDASWTDIGVHAIAVLLVVLANRALAGAVLRARG